jgi:hypothetical protein
MIPELGQHVKCFMRSTMVLEGIVEEWSADQVVLKSLEDDQSILIIHRPTDDIAITKIMTGQPQEKTELELPEIRQEIKAKLDEVLHPISDDADLEKLNILQLRKLVIEQEKKIIAEKTKEHFGSAGHAKLTPYSTPRSAYVPGKLPNTPGAEMARNRKK